MLFRHGEPIWVDFPDLVAGAIFIDGVNEQANVSEKVAELTNRATTRIDSGTESDLPEIQAWRRTFSKMGLKPTQYRCASEALLRRLRKDTFLPSIHPVIDLCNAYSVAYAIPVAVFDTSKITGNLIVRRAIGSEMYETFTGDIENPEPDEVIFVDDAERAHARRWVNRQSAYSAVRPETTSILVVSEAMHPTAAQDVRHLIEELSFDFGTIWNIRLRAAILTRDSPSIAR
jgi:DNA/RNA-binding domain of Phe-tRNA-synthetase-like protein